MDKEKEKRELLIRMRETEKQFEKNKLKRTIYVIGFYSLLIMSLFYVIEDGFDSVLDFLGTLGGSVFLAAVVFLINATILSQLFEKGRRENEIIKRMEEKYKELSEEGQE